MWITQKTSQNGELLIVDNPIEPREKLKGSNIAPQP